MVGIVKEPVIAVYEGPYTETLTKDGLMVSAIVDEGLYGMIFGVTGEDEGGFTPVKTFYGYTGYVKTEEMLWIHARDGKAWDDSGLMVAGGRYTDVVSAPRVRGVRLQSLYRGSLVRVIELESEETGWAKVGLVDGSVGYMRNQYLWKKEFSQAGSWEPRLPQKVVEETSFREEVVKRAVSYLGVQYRWGGRSTAGVDCSGLTSACYMLCGILIYRDARMVEGYPVHEIAASEMKPGDLLYFPGHIAMYLGNGSYIHATGKAGSGGVVINSLNPSAADYRADLADSLYAVGSIF
ncbi:MAG: C40 family peptidase [Hungatella hathewayi]|nr:C40 family peptidase [Hungatella hathewayi]